MNEYVIHAKVKNNLLLSRILQDSGTVNGFCLKHGLSPSCVGELINMKKPALLRSGRWSELSCRLADILGCLPEDLFTEEQRTVELRTNEAYIEISRQQALGMVDPIKCLEDTDLIEKLLKTSGLNENQKTVLKLRYEEDLNLDEVAEKFGLTRERIRQIEQKALRKLQSTARKQSVFYP